MVEWIIPMIAGLLLDALGAFMIVKPLLNLEFGDDYRKIEELTELSLQKQNLDSDITQKRSESLRYNLGRRVMEQIEKRLMEKYNVTLEEGIADFSKIDLVLREFYGTGADGIEREIGRNAQIHHVEGKGIQDRLLKEKIKFDLENYVKNYRHTTSVKDMVKWGVSFLIFGFMLVIIANIQQYYQNI